MTWVQRLPATSPPGRVQHGTVYDALRQRVVLFGGLDQQDDTWEWDGTAWTQRMTAASPPQGSGRSLAYDPVSQRVVLFAEGGMWVLLP